MVDGGTTARRPATLGLANTVDAPRAPERSLITHVETARRPAEPGADRPLLGRFTLLRILGQGGMGVVWRAYDEVLDRPVAIKTIRADRAAVAAYSRFLREARALAKLSHPNVVQLYDVNVGDDGEIFLAMEYVKGGTLRERIAREPRPSRATILELFAQAGLGLAAAHAAGLVHRDFKPDNVLVGDDGRVRVVDFGLVGAFADAHDDEPRPTRPEAPAEAFGRDLLTHAGAVLGTPGYMSPEQLCGRAADARSDQFSFCVALFEALYGRRPFRGDTEATLRQAVLVDGVDLQPDDRVPVWLRVILLRGLAVEPHARWPDMPTLLAALQRDPDAQRRSRLRIAALLVVAGLSAAVLALGVVAIQRWWARERAETEAEARLLGLGDAMRRADEAGDPAAAEAAFRAFVTDPAHRETRALARAYMQRGDRQRVIGEQAAALAAYADSYLHARAAPDVAAALRGLAEVFAATFDGVALGRTVAVLRARGVDDPALAALAVDAALLQRDLSGAADELRRAHDVRLPLLAALASARSTEVQALFVSSLAAPHGDVAHVAVQPDYQVARLLSADLRVRATVEPGGRLHPPCYGTTWISQTDGDELSVIDLLDPKRPLWRTRERGWITTWPIDLGAGPEVLFGEGTRLRMLSGLGGPVVDERVLDAALTDDGSYLEYTISTDLDGDGRLELIAAVGPWRAYDLRVFTIGDDGHLTLVARQKFGRISALAVLERRGERLLAVLKDDLGANPDVFPEPPHTGVPAGILLLRWTGSGFAPVDRVPLPRDRSGAAVGARQRLLVADLDGDGDDELIAPLDSDSGISTLIAHPGRDGGWHSVYVSSLLALGAAQLDDDPASELLVATPPEYSLWALGAGDERLPSLRTDPPAARPPPAELADPLLADRWARADDLAAVGISASAAAGLQAAADFTRDGQARRHLHARAAELRVAAGDDVAALALDTLVMADPVLAPAALERSAGALERLGRYDEAAAAVDALLVHPGRNAAQEAAARALRARIASLVAQGARLAIDFAAPLVQGWRIAHPGVLQRDHDGLAFALVADERPAAALPIVWDGGALALDVSLDVAQVEYDACMRIEVRDADDRPWLGASICGGGGGGELHQTAAFTVGEQDWYPAVRTPVTSARTPRRLRWRIAYIPERHAAECALEYDGQTARVLLTVARVPTPGPQLLALGAWSEHVPEDMISGTLRRLVLHGARPLRGDEEPRDRAARLLVEDRGAEALELLDTLPPTPQLALWTALADDARHDPVAARAALADVLRDRSCCTADLIQLLRTRPGLATAVRELAGPDVLPLLAQTWWTLGWHHRRDPPIRRVVLDALRGVEALAAAGPDQLRAQRRLLALRGLLWDLGGERERALADLRVALEIPDQPDVADAETRADLHIHLARLLVATDPARALAHATAAMSVAPVPAAVRLRLGDLPELADRRDDPAWHALMMP